MTIKKNISATEAVLMLEGRLDTVTAPELEKVINELVSNTKVLILDFIGLDYLSSAGLRVLLVAQKAMSRKGELRIRNVNDVIMDVFDMTGFSAILTIED